MNRSNAMRLLVALSLLATCRQTLGNSDTESCCTSGEYRFRGEFRALFLQAAADNLGYAVEAIPLPLPSPDWQVFRLSPSYRFGFDLVLSAYCKETGRSFMFNYERITNHANQTQSLNQENMVGPFFEIGPDATTYKQCAGSVQFTLNEAHADIGQEISTAHCLDTMIFGGIGVASIKECLSSRFKDIKNTTSRTILTPLSFVGAGPELGIDLGYRFGNYIRATARGSITLLAGTGKNHTTYLATSPALVPLGVSEPNHQQTTNPHARYVVPYLYSRVGLAYQRECHHSYLVSAELGYQVQAYVNALRSINISSEVITPPVIPGTVGVFARTFHQSINSFSLQGPYCSFKLTF